MNYSIFRIRHKSTVHSPGTDLGTATFSDNGVRFQPNHSSDWLIKQNHKWLTEFHRNCRRMIRSVGHNSKFSILWDENTGLEVERK